MNTSTNNVGKNNGTFNQFEGLGGDDTITGNTNTKVIYSNATAGVTITIGAGGAGSAQGTVAGDAASVGQRPAFTGGVNSRNRQQLCRCLRRAPPSNQRLQRVPGQQRQRPRSPDNGITPGPVWQCYF